MALKLAPYIADDDILLTDARPWYLRFNDQIRDKNNAFIFCLSVAMIIYIHRDGAALFSDAAALWGIFYFIWLKITKTVLPLKLPMTMAKKFGKKADGILFVGNDQYDNEEIWISNSDARTHILYLGTTGSGKTEGLKSLATNSLCWGSGFIYVDGKADTDLWSSISALARRFGRDDDLMVLNYMTGNSDAAAVSNTINPFSFGSASYLTNMMVSLMPESGGDNAMWKDRAVALIAALMPVLTWKRNNQEFQLSINALRDCLHFKKIVQLSREEVVPEKLRRGLQGYLSTLPGYDDNFFADDGSEKQGPGGQAQDLSVVYQQHGYLSMQFTRSLQSLADDYGYIFEVANADIDIHDIVLNRRILVVLIPALEKSGDETANLGKILASMLKGMMGGTLGSQVEGNTEQAIENKATRAPTPYMTIFDEVGYYTVEGMAVMAAQARSLGFSLVFAAQDLPGLEKRVREEARSITANCNLKIFGKLEDPVTTREFYEKTVGKEEVTRMSGYKREDGVKMNDSVTIVDKAIVSYKKLKSYKEGQAVVNFGRTIIPARMFYANPKGIKALRVHRMLALPPADPEGKRSGKDLDNVLERFNDKSWTAENCMPSVKTETEIGYLVDGFAAARKEKEGLVESGIIAVAHLAQKSDLLKADTAGSAESQQEKSPPVVAPSTEDIKQKEEALQINEEMADKPEETQQQDASSQSMETMSWAQIISQGNKQPKDAKSTVTEAPAKSSEAVLPQEEKESAPVEGEKPKELRATREDEAEPVSWAQLVSQSSSTPKPQEKPSQPDNKTVQSDDEDNESDTSFTDQPLTWAQLINKDKKDD